MYRRDFIRLSSSLMLLPQACHRAGTTAELPFDMHIKNDMAQAHLILQKTPQKISQKRRTKTLIVGGGIAGLSAAVELSGQDFLLCELSNDLGGSASRGVHRQTVFSQGAHYDLAYPDHFGEEALTFLAKLGIIAHKPFSKMWAFKDEQFLISPKREEQMWDGSRLTENTLMESAEADSFFALMENYHDKLRLPSRLINREYWPLGNMYFSDFLDRELPYLSGKLKRAIDYQMADDFSAGARGVSALAGLYYYGNRAYRTEEAEIFSPPQGNYYFAEKMLANIPQNNLLNQHLVVNIDCQGPKQIRALVLDLVNRDLVEVSAESVIYAGHKHALPHVMPTVAKPFANNQYAPWLVINIVLKEPLLERGYWQNEVPTSSSGFIGFVDSDAQYNGQRSQRVLSAYYCFKPEERKKMASFTDAPKVIVEDAIKKVSRFFNADAKELTQKVEAVYLKAMGHAMPIPTAGYLFKDANLGRPYSNVVFAGTDNGRLPLLLEAVDSGLQAVSQLKKSGLLP